MHFIKYSWVAIILFTACRTTRTAATDIGINDIQPTIAAAVSGSNSIAPAIAASQPDTSASENFRIDPEVLATSKFAKANHATTVKSRQHITSFSQMKKMAQNGDIAMSKKDLKILNRLEKHYNGNYEQFRADAFELTDKAKIIGGIGVLGLLIGIIFGSAFGWFLFVVAALAFLLRYLNIIMF